MKTRLICCAILTRWAVGAERNRDEQLFSPTLKYRRAAALNGIIYVL
jgi:hypothetical protein